MEYSSLFDLATNDLRAEAEVETRLLLPLFAELGYPAKQVLPKPRVDSLKIVSGTKSSKFSPDFLILRPDRSAFIVVEAKDPSIEIEDAWDQAASYALSYNKDKAKDKQIKWILISNGKKTALFLHDRNSSVVTLNLKDFSSGNPPLVALKTYIKEENTSNLDENENRFETILPAELNKRFESSHQMIWKREKLSPSDAFYEFCKFVFMKIRADKQREQADSSVPLSALPLTTPWLEQQSLTAKHPVRDILFKALVEELETQIENHSKKRIFEKNESFKLDSSTTKALIESFESVNLSSIDEDLNGRMFEVFLNAAVRGKELGQYFTPRPVVDFMTRIGLSRIRDYSQSFRVIDGCCGTAGFLIEVMAYAMAAIRNDKRLTNLQKESLYKKIKEESLFGIDANERVARIARINMYLHGDGGSHIFHSDGLDADPEIEDEYSNERKKEISDSIDEIRSESFDLVLSNPPFSMKYDRKEEDEEKILDSLGVPNSKKREHSNVLYLYRYEKLLKEGGEMLIVLDDTILNGKSRQDVRTWILEKFVLLGVHSLPFNAFFKAKANIKTSILHLRKKSQSESQGHVFMSISNNVGHDNSLRDTPERNNLSDVFSDYYTWITKGEFEGSFKDNHDREENLECPFQTWLVPFDEIDSRRLDAFYYATDLRNLRREIEDRAEQGEVEIKRGRDYEIVEKLRRIDKRNLIASGERLKYFEIGDVTQFGLIVSSTFDFFENLPTRGEYQIAEGDVLFALNNSSRGTVVLVPKEFDGAICTSGFLVLRPRSKQEGLLLWFALRSEFCRSQIYYLSQSASQPELKLDVFVNEFLIPFPDSISQKALDAASALQKGISDVIELSNVRYE